MGFWRTEEPVLGDPLPSGVRPVKVGGMFAPQREWYHAKEFIRLLVGGYGSGKSLVLCKWSIAAALHNAPAWSAIVSPNFPLARRTILPTIRTLLSGKQRVRKDMQWREDKGEKQFVIQIENRPPATLIYLSGDNPENLKGPNLGTAAIDEPFIQERAVFDQMMARCRDPMAKLHALGLTGTPEQLNWGYDIAEGEEQGKHEIKVIRADTRDNKSLPPQYVERLLTAWDQKTADAYIKGLFVNLSKGQVFYGFNKAVNVKQILGRDSEGVTHFAGMDFNVNPMAFVIGWFKKERCHIYAEYELPNSDTEEAASIIRREHPLVRQVYPDPTGKHRSTNAPAGQSDFKLLTKAGLFVFTPQQPWPRRDSFTSVNQRYSKGLLTVDPSCKKLIRYLSEHTWELMTKQESMSHLLDAHRYPVTYLYPAFKHVSGVFSLTGS